MEDHSSFACILSYMNTNLWTTMFLISLFCLLFSRFSWQCINFTLMNLYASSLPLSTHLHKYSQYHMCFLEMIYINIHKISLMKICGIKASNSNNKQVINKKHYLFQCFFKKIWIYILKFAINWIQKKRIVSQGHIKY